MGRREYFMAWRFASYADAVKALQHIVEEEVCICSCGSGDEQYDGFMYDEGVIKLIPTKVPSEDKTDESVMLVWYAEAEDISDYWLSPYCFEIDVTTYDENMKDSRGEAFDWGSIVK